MKKYIIITISLLQFTVMACKKNGTGGENIIAAYPKHHNVIIPNATVYIKYGARELPGTNASDYDDSRVVKAEGSSEPHAHFENLLKGDYYLYAVGYDSSANAIVKGGLAVKITSKSGEEQVNIAVTE